jgi:hypothetical protein
MNWSCFTASECNEVNSGENTDCFDINIGRVLQVNNVLLDVTNGL